jgi:glycosyltransferase involved in cell wall biosynthesis
MSNFSAAIIAYNEEKHIARTLQSLHGVIEDIVVVIDDKTTDKTEEIAQRLGAKTIQKKFENYGEQKQFAVEQTNGSWVLNIDADEAIDDVLKSELLQLKNNPQADAYTVNIKNFYCGKWMRWGGVNSTKRIRIFHKHKGSWNRALVHEKIDMHPQAIVHHLKGSILHIAYESPQEHLEKIHKYSSLHAKSLSHKSLLVLLFKCIFSPMSKFITSYLIKLGFLEGKQGWQFAVFMSYETFLKYRKALRLKVVKSYFSLR